MTKGTATAAFCILVALGAAAHAGERGDNRRHDRGTRHEQRRDHGRDHRNDRSQWDRRASHDGRHDDRRDWDRRDWDRRDRDRRHSRDRYDQRRHEGRYDARRHDHRGYDNRRYVYSAPSRHHRYDYPRYHQRFRAGYYHRPHGYHAYRWYPGARLPVAYYAPRYVIHDYHAYHLHAPPYGYHWVRVDDDVVLAAIATGIVLQVVNQVFW